MNFAEIAKRLTALDAALIEKTGEQPFVGAGLRINQIGRACISLYRAYRDDGYEIGTAKGETLEEVFADAERIIAALPSPEEAGINEYLRKVADAIDCGHKYCLADEYVAPLRDVTKAMTGNLLTTEANE